MKIIPLLILYLVTINLITLILFGHDKKLARRKKQRIPEKTLLFFACIGGSLGAELGMYSFHHKTRHPRFFLGIPLLLLIQTILLFFIFQKLL